MILALDIGNTNIHAGLYQNERLTELIILPTKNAVKSKFLTPIFRNRNIEGVGIASVVPILDQRIIGYINNHYGVKTILVNSSLKMPVRMAYKNLGADRIANIVAGFYRYQHDIIIFAFGTATVYDVVLKTGIHLGGAIFPGIDTQLRSLNEQTAQIKTFTLKTSSRLLGKNTDECIQTGIFNSTKFAVQGFIRATMRLRKHKYKTIATGGWGKIMSRLVPEISRYDSDLTLYGILKLFCYNG